MIDTIKKVWDNSGKGWSEKADFEWIVQWMSSELHRHAWKSIDVPRDDAECAYFSSAEFMGYEDIHLIDNAIHYTMGNDGHEDEDAYKVTVWFNTISDAIQYWQDHIKVPVKLRNMVLQV
ncbi:MAG: hypothetical protein LBG87_09845 [Spirochaetaceae bacterium]|jgi:hypothetical protein|nr:hypothetical protein [Spirochaetaceae bacterium]